MLIYMLVSNYRCHFGTSALSLSGMFFTPPRAIRVPGSPPPVKKDEKDTSPLLGEVPIMPTTLPDGQPEEITNEDQVMPLGLPEGEPSGEPEGESEGEPEGITETPSVKGDDYPTPGAPVKDRPRPKKDAEAVGETVIRVLFPDA